MGGGVTPKMQKLNSKLGDERVTCLAQGWERGIWWTLVKKVIIKSVVQQEFHSTRNPLLGLLKSSSAPGVGCQKVALTGFGQALSLWCLPHRKRGSCGSCKLPLSGGYGFAPPPAAVGFKRPTCLPKNPGSAAERSLTIPLKFILCQTGSDKNGIKYQE